MRNHWLDLLKIVFVLIISFLHTCWWENMRFGFLPVEFFFIVSGYFTWVSYDMKKRRLREFVTNKIVRLLPTYLCILALYAVFSLTFPQFYNGVSFDYWGLSLIREIFLLQSTGLTEAILDIEIMRICHVSWYVSVYFWGSLLLYCLLLRLQKYSTYVLMCIVLGVYGFYFLFWEDSLEIWSYKGLFYMPLWRGLAGMSLGILIGKAMKRDNFINWIEANHLFFNLISAFALIGAFACFFSKNDISYIAIICFVCLLINSICKNGINRYFAKFKLAKYIPDISLEILLLHHILIPVSVKITDTLGLLHVDVVKWLVYSLIVFGVSLSFNILLIPGINRSIGFIRNFTFGLAR